MKRLDLIIDTLDYLNKFTNIDVAEALAAARSLREMKPFIYMYEVNQTYTQLCKELPPDDAYDEGTLVPLYALGDKK